LKVLGRFARYLKENPSARVAAIATGSFRKAGNTESFINAAGNKLGCRIQVLSGQDESLLCYMGIASAVGFSDQNRLVIDIGGGSTELIIAKKNEIIQYCSIDIGCVSLTRDLLGDKKIGRQNLEQAVQVVINTISPFTKRFMELGWHEVLGCGGTVSSLFAILQARRMGGRFITTAGLDRFTSKIFETGSATETAGSIVPADRIRLLPAGAAVLMGIYRQLEIEKIQPVFSSVNQGLLVELARQQQRSGHSNK
jgi:exopolyphosphatase/guanosine-5'-triphosphate,3'-diphosphate pyrophosphatase